MTKQQEALRLADALDSRRSETPYINEAAAELRRLHAATQPTTHISQTGACVDQAYFWQPIDTCPRSAKVQLLGAGGVAVYSSYDGKDPFWRAWAPLPKKPEWMK